MVSGFEVETRIEQLNDFLAWVLGCERIFSLDADPAIREKGQAMSVALSIGWHLESPLGKDAFRVNCREDDFNGYSGSRIRKLR